MSINLKWVGGIALALIIITAGKVVMTSRGIRNNNPGNIRKTNDMWMGLKRDQTDDPDFFQFVSPDWGIRAMAKIIDKYKSRGVLTVEDIISTWAPASENNTESYIKSVLRHTGWPPNTVPIKSEGDYQPLIMAIIKHENGVQPYALKVIDRGIAMSAPNWTA